MEETLDKALSSVLEGEISPEELAVPAAIETLESSNLGVLALDHYNKAKAYLRQENWVGYGEELAKLEAILKQLSMKTK